jgi:nitrogen regulatory protein PII
MKMLIASIRCEDLPAVQEALDRRVACLMSVTPVQAHGPEPAFVGRYRGSPFRVRRARLRLEIALDDDFVEAAARAIAGAMSAEDCHLPSEQTMFVMRAVDMECVRPGG